MFNIGYSKLTGNFQIMLQIGGLSMGFVSNLVMGVLVMAGEFIDREIGFTMASNFDPNTGAMVTITAEFYDRMVCLIILIAFFAVMNIILFRRQIFKRKKKA